MEIIAHTMTYRGNAVSSPLKLRNYADKDYEEYARICNSCFSEMRKALEITPLDCCESREKLLQKKSQIFIFEADGKLVGSVALYDNEIDDLFVDEAFQGKGYGRALLEFAVSTLQNQDKSPIILHVADRNQKAIKMYLNFGFQITATEAIR